MKWLNVTNSSSMKYLQHPKLVFGLSRPPCTHMYAFGQLLPICDKCVFFFGNHPLPHHVTYVFKYLCTKSYQTLKQLKNNRKQLKEYCLMLLTQCLRRKRREFLSSNLHAQKFLVLPSSRFSTGKCPRKEVEISYLYTKRFKKTS